MGLLAGVQDWLDERLGPLAAEYGVPGAVVAVLKGDEVAEAATGVLSLGTGVEVTTDSVFQIGSITKVWTATLVIELVDEGRVDLDVPVRTYLPGFRVADERATATITVRDLLCHRAGFESYQPQTTRGDDAVQRWFEDVLPIVSQLFPPGEMWSYCNGGYGVLGRLIEVLRDLPYTTAVRRYLVEPLGLQHVATCADEAILFRAAVGHHLGSPTGEEQTPTRTWALPHCIAPSGGLTMSARDLLCFARLHLRGGLTPGGARLVAETSVAAMQEPQIEHPPQGARPSSQGLGWFLHDWVGGPVLAHGGATIGQISSLWMAPAQDVAVALVTNGGRAGRLGHDLSRHLLEVTAGIEVPPQLARPAEPKPVDNPLRYVGPYQTLEVRVDVETNDQGTLSWVTTDPDADASARADAPRLELVHIDTDSFLLIAASGDVLMTITFGGEDTNGRTRYARGTRVVPRVN